MTKDRIIIQKDNIPYRFSIQLPRTQYDLEIRYNDTADMFTASLYKNGSRICIEPILYGRRLFGQLYQAGTYPMLIIVPQSSSGDESRVTWDNFGETVFLEIQNSEVAE